jgi:steroid 5-alpha reductase family enzyme
MPILTGAVWEGNAALHDFHTLLIIALCTVWPVRLSGTAK